MDKFLHGVKKMKKVVMAVMVALVVAFISGGAIADEKKGQSSLTKRRI